MRLTRSWFGDSGRRWARVYVELRDKFIEGLSIALCKIFFKNKSVKHRKPDITFNFSCNAFVTNDRYMSLFNISSCFTLEFVAIGRRTRVSVFALFLDGMLALSCTKDFSETLLGGGPAFGALRLNCECVEWASISAFSGKALRDIPR
jgi:hypothetical protein